MEARKLGLDVIYLPGSYDLVHVGHLSYVDQVVSHYLEETARLGRNLDRGNLFLVMLADDDQLIGRIKAGKYIGNGGDELFRRPVEAGLDEHGRSPRLDSLASFPVDCVGFIPSPEVQNLPGSYGLDISKCRDIAASISSSSELDHYNQILESYQRIEELFAHHESLERATWSIAAWQLYITLQIANPQPQDINTTPQPFSGECITRAISAHDKHYLDAVKMISRWSGVGVTVIDDVEAVSTTGLLQRFGPKTLLERKATSIRDRGSDHST